MKHGKIFALVCLIISVVPNAVATDLGPAKTQQLAAQEGGRGTKRKAPESLEDERAAQHRRLAKPQEPACSVPAVRVDAYRWKPSDYLVQAEAENNEEQVAAEAKGSEEKGKQAKQQADDEDPQIVIPGYRYLNALDEKDRTFLMNAVVRDDWDMIRKLIQSPGIKIDTQNSKGETALIMAFRNGNIKVAQELFRVGAQIGEKQKLLDAILQGNRNVQELRKLVDQQELDEALWDASGAVGFGDSDVEEMRQLANRGANFNNMRYSETYCLTTKTIRTLHTPLMDAAAWGNKNSVKNLLLAGANPNYQNESGITALLMAAGTGNEESNFPSVQYLIEARADVNHKDKEGNTPLMYAQSYGNYRIASLLLNAGARINEQDNEGNTALMQITMGKKRYGGANENFYKTVQLLLSRGADLSIKNKEDKTAYDIAVEQKDEKLQKMFKEHQARMGQESKKSFTAGAGAGKR